MKFYFDEDASGRLATALRRDTQDTADDAVGLEATIGRAVSALKRQRFTVKLLFTLFVDCI